MHTELKMSVVCIILVHNLFQFGVQGHNLGEIFFFFCCGADDSAMAQCRNHCPSSTVVRSGGDPTKQVGKRLTLC